ncbi:MAG: hypothetical protein ACM3US_14870 [Sphingomonadaceae bacterium]
MDNRRWTLLFASISLLGLSVLASCTDGDTSRSGSAVTATPRASVAGLSPTAVPTLPPATRQPGVGQGAGNGEQRSAMVVITGQVRDVSASARVITFVQPVHGLSSVALTDVTEITGPDGGPRTLQDVKPGVVIQVAGEAGGSEAVRASKVRILTAPSPIPAAQAG